MGQRGLRKRILDDMIVKEIVVDFKAVNWKHKMWGMAAVKLRSSKMFSSSSTGLKSSTGVPKEIKTI